MYGPKTQPRPGREPSQEISSSVRMRSRGLSSVPNFALSGDDHAAMVPKVNPPMLTARADRDDIEVQNDKNSFGTHR